MKKIFFLLSALMTVLGANAQKSWDFTVISDDDVAALNDATTEWKYEDKTDFARYSNIKDISGVVMAGNTELELLKGLKVSAVATKLRIDATKRVQLAGKNVAIIIPGLKKGQKVTITCASTGDNATTLDNLSNLTNASGFTAADKNTTQTGTATVMSDGDVSVSSSTGSMNIFSILVEASEGGEGTGKTTVIKLVQEKLEKE